MDKTANAIRCQRYRDKKCRLYQVAPITLYAPIPCHETLKEMAGSMTQGYVKRLATPYP
jgi:hypothetical protein